MIDAATVAEWAKFTLPVGSELALLERVLSATIACIERDFVVSDPRTPQQEQAIMIKCAKLWRRRDSTDGVAAFGDFGVVRVSSYEDADVIALLERKLAFA